MTDIPSSCHPCWTKQDVLYQEAPQRRPIPTGLYSMRPATSTGSHETAPRCGSWSLGWMVWEESKAGGSKGWACAMTERTGGGNLESNLPAGSKNAKKLQRFVQLPRNLANNTSGNHRWPLKPPFPTFLLPWPIINSYGLFREVSTMPNSV